MIHKDEFGHPLKVWKKELGLVYYYCHECNCLIVDVV
jgi:hypothetical protein